MRKFLAIVFLVVLSGCGQVDSPSQVFDDEVFEEGEVAVEQEEDERILLIVGEGGPSGSMFIRAAETFRRENGGEIYEVHSGDDFVFAMNDFLKNNEKIDRLEFFGHGNHIALYVNQSPNVHGGIYLNDPRTSANYLAASLYEVSSDAFSEDGMIWFNGCNTADGYPEKETFAQKVANYFDVEVIAPMGPTEFSRTPEVVDPIPNSNYLAPDFQGEVYMVPTYEDKGFVTVEPQERGASPYSDVREGADYYDAVVGLSSDGSLFGGREFLPYYNTTYSDAVALCRVVFGEEAVCKISGYEEENMIRNLHVLQMLVDASGEEVGWSSPWSQAYLSWANQRSLLTKEFVMQKWYTRAEAAQLAWNFLLLNEGQL